MTLNGKGKKKGMVPQQYKSGNVVK